jgi:pyruvate dehydrogenase E2 component (dihydrolipoamide acetyltransferase)
MPDVIMPKMGDAMETGVVTSWLKHEGDHVEVGDTLAEIDTDKTTVELEAEDAGTLHRLIVGEGDEVPVGDSIAVILAEGEEPPSDGGAQTQALDQPSDTAQDEAAAQDQAAKDADGATGSQSVEPEQETPATSDTEASTDGRLRASPITRRLAREHGIDLSEIDGTGPAGRLVERDVRAVLEGGGAPAEEDAPEQTEEARAGENVEPESSSHRAATDGAEVVPLSRGQRVVGDRLQQSWQQSPHHYATVEVNVDELLTLRRTLNEALVDEGGKLSINDFVLKACAVALRSFPKLNSWWTDEGVQRNPRVDLAMAVAQEDGLITPVIRDAANRTLSALSAEAKDLADRARENRLRPEEYQGGTFTVSNMGMYGVESFTAIVNPPSVSIVAVSSVIRRPGFDDQDNVVAQNVLKLTIGSDHRVVNGAENARYLAEVKRLLERPVLLTV